jgi:hypothetical protein
MRVRYVMAVGWWSVGTAAADVAGGLVREPHRV